VDSTAANWEAVAAVAAAYFNLFSRSFMPLLFLFLFVVVVVVFLFSLHTQCRTNETDSPTAPHQIDLLSSY